MSWMMRAQSRSGCHTVASVVLILCVVVMMQMLGLPVSLWDVNQEYEEISDPTIGWAMPSAVRVFISMPSWFGALLVLCSPADPLLVRSLFHPPR